MKLELKNVGPHAHLELSLSPGVNVLTGENGAGKSSAIAAATAALGGDAAVEARDGSSGGQVSCDGAVLLKIGKRLGRNGVPSVELGNHGAVGDIIDPGIADPIKADAARIKAVLALVPIPLTQDVLKTLGWASSNAPAAQSVVDAADVVRRRMNERGLEAERLAAEAAGKRKGAEERVQQFPEMA